MFDHILCYANAADRPAGPLGADGAPFGYPSWDDEQARTWAPVKCIISDAVYTRRDDGSHAIVTPAVHAPGHWMVVRTVARDAELEADPRCLIVSDSRRAAAGKPFVLLCRLAQETLLGRISPTFAGDAYPFPAGPASALAPLMVASTEPDGTRL